MGIADKLATRAHNRLKKCAEKEAQKTGTVIEHFERIVMDEGGAWATTAKVLFSRTASTKQIQLFHLRNGDQRFLYFEPFDNAVQLPGEFHARLMGGLPQPVTYVKSGWITNDDEELMAKLQGHAELKKALKKLRWVKGNQVRVTLDWGLQISSLGDGTSHVVMQAGSFGMFTESPGIAVFLEILGSLRPLLQSEHVEAQNLYFECQRELFNAFVEETSVD